jgi:uncharacterized membrane protein
VEEIGTELARGLKLVVELASVLVVGVGVIVVGLEIARGILHRRMPNFNQVRLGLARYLVLALELQLGADIIGTAISPSWQQIGELGAIAVIRTALNYFLGREMEETTTALREESATAGDPRS